MNPPKIVYAAIVFGIVLIGTGFFITQISGIFTNAQGAQKITGTVVLRDQPKSSASELATTVTLPASNCTVDATNCGSQNFWIWNRSGLQYNGNSSIAVPNVSSQAFAARTMYTCGPGATGGPPQCTPGAANNSVFDVQSAPTEGGTLGSMDGEFWSVYKTIFGQWYNWVAATNIEFGGSSSVTHELIANNDPFPGANKYKFTVKWEKSATQSDSCNVGGTGICNASPPWETITEEHTLYVVQNPTTNLFDGGFNAVSGGAGSVQTTGCNTLRENVSSDNYVFYSANSYYAAISYSCT